MLRSMTGFGRGTASQDGVWATAEIRAVNHRFLDVAVRLPSAWAAWERRVIARVEPIAVRGRWEVVVRRQGPAAPVQLDGARLRQFAGELGALEAETGKALTLDALIQLPGVLRADDVAVGDGEVDLLDEAVSSAVSAVEDMRLREGEGLAGALGAVLDELDAGVVQARGAAVGQRQRVGLRLAQRLADVGVELDPARRQIEAALLADKADVTEELDRLSVHLGHLRKTLTNGGAVGRRVEFLAVEVGREVTTLGNKSVDVVLSSAVVELKTQLERLREQAANVL